MPKSAPLPPTAPAPQKPVVLEDGKEIVVKNFKRGTNWMKAVIETETKVEVAFPAFDFPSWRAWIDDQPTKITHDDELGRIVITLSPGKHQVYLRLTNTPIRAWSNLVSLLSWWALLLVVTKKKWQKLLAVR